MRCLLKLHQLDSRMQLNPYIGTGYRPRMGVMEAVRSFFSLHNESFNMWSHAAAACLVLYLMMLPPVEDLLVVSDKVVSRHRVSSASELSFLLSASPAVVFRSACLMAFLSCVLSVACHTLAPCDVSGTAWMRLLGCDALGTVLITTGTAWSFLYRGNPCASLHSSHCVAALLFLLSALVLVFILRSRSCSSPAVRGRIMGLFSVPYVALVLWVEVPKAHTQGHHTAVNYHVLSWLFVALGAFCSASHFPEAHLSRVVRCIAKRSDKRADWRSRWRKWFRRYLLSGNEIDYMWNSHNIWHYCLVLCVIAKLLGCRYDMVEFELARCAA